MCVRARVGVCVCVSVAGGGVVLYLDVTCTI